MKNAQYETNKQFMQRRLKESKAAGVKHYITEIRGTGNDVEVELPNDYQCRLFKKHICKWSGFKTGYGTWILSPSYKVVSDWNDKTSAHHY